MPTSTIPERKRCGRKFRRLHAGVRAARTEERKRLARELHDGVGQILTGVKFMLHSLPGKGLVSEDGESEILKAGEYVDHAIAEIRRISRNLMPPELTDLGLEPALRRLCREFKDCAGSAVTVRTVSASVSPALALALYRIAQEALNNVEKHSEATMVAVDLSRKGKELVLSVRDNGVGFPLNRRTQRGIGLISMRERAESAGGSLEVLSARGSGTTLSIRVPLRRKEETRHEEKIEPGRHQGLSRR